MAKEIIMRANNSSDRDLLIVHPPAMTCVGLSLFVALSRTAMQSNDQNLPLTRSFVFFAFC
jgi:hypothetical protein